MKRALITGITGQDGSYLAEFLLLKGYEVHGLVRRASTFNTARIDHIFEDIDEKKPQLITHNGDLCDFSSILRVMEDVKPDEVYNLAAQSHVGYSFDAPEYTFDANGTGTVRLLEAIKQCGLIEKTKFYNAATSELFGGISGQELNENSNFSPRSPYAISKLSAYWMTKLFRDAHKLFAVNGILFNHESPRRGETFVTRKITRGLARLVYGLQGSVYLGNLDSVRDWGHAKDYIEAQWLMLQRETPRDYVIASGNCISVREFIDVILDILGITVIKSGHGLDEVWRVTKIEHDWKLEIGQPIIQIHQRFFRPLEVDHLLGDASLARNELGWKPKYTVHSMAQEMIERDCQAAKLSLQSIG